jgi:hypothetical protein
LALCTRTPDDGTISGVPFRPIETVDQLPAIGTHREELNLDFKATLKDTKQAEIAKDVAAFANAAGGTLLIGATEDAATNTLGGWVPISSPDAHAAVTAVVEAVKERCSPSPVIDPKVIERSLGSFVVAVNVWPFPLLPVSVRVSADPALTDKQWNTWAVFVRVGNVTKNFTPEQAAMLMIPQLRQTISLLDAVPHDRRQSMRISFRMFHMTVGQRERVAYGDLVEVRPLENVAVFRSAKVKRHDHDATVPVDVAFHVPLNAIDAVWSEPHDHWSLRVNGWFRFVEGKGLFYLPNEE